MAKAWGGTFSESNALSFSEHVPGDAVPTAHHVDKRRLKRKGLEVVFDPAAHKEFVTGFHKRKLQRRKEAQEKLEEKARKLRLEERAKKREEQRTRLQLDRYETPPPSGDEAPPGTAAAPPRVLEYAASGLQTTVTVAPISMYSDEEPCSSGGEGEGEDASGAAGRRARGVAPGVRERAGGRTGTAASGRPAGSGQVGLSAGRGALAGRGRGRGGRCARGGRLAGRGAGSRPADAASGAAHARKQPAGTFSRLAQPRGAGAAGEAPRGAGAAKRKGAKAKKKRR